MIFVVASISVVTLVIGCNGSHEDLFHTVLDPALARGWNAITFEGPGHQQSAPQINIGSIHNWELATMPLTDYALSAKRGCCRPGSTCAFRLLRSWSSCCTSPSFCSLIILPSRSIHKGLKGAALYLPPVSARYHSTGVEGWEGAVQASFFWKGCMERSRYSQNPIGETTSNVR
jgi:hypothetical protein